jgi:hypothetical protein
MLPQLPRPARHFAGIMQARPGPDRNGYEIFGVFEGSPFESLKRPDHPGCRFRCESHQKVATC